MNYLSERHIRRRRFLRLLVVLLGVAFLAALYPFLSGGWQRLSAALDTALSRHYAARLETLRQENAQLRAQLAQNAPMADENDALRAVIDCERLSFSDGKRWLTGHVCARWQDGMTLSGFDTALPCVGDVVLDRYARFVGQVVGVDHTTATVAFAGTAQCPTTGQIELLFGLYHNKTLSGLPRDTRLEDGLLVTANGCWLGVIGGERTVSTDGLTVSYRLEDTADLEDGIYFVQQDAESKEE